MKKLFNLIGLLLTAVALSVVPVSQALQAAVVTVAGPGNAYVPNMFLYGIVSDGAITYTNATTTATAIPGMSVAIPATRGDYTKQNIRVCWTVDGTKATATTGAVQVFVNGAVDTASTRYTSSGAARNTIAGCYTVQRSSAAAQTVALYGVSGDTNTFTVNAGSMEVWDLRFN